MQPRDPTLLSAQFDPRLETYFMLQAQALLLCTFIGIPLMPFWFVFARGIHRVLSGSLHESPEVGPVASGPWKRRPQQVPRHSTQP